MFSSRLLALLLAAAATTSTVVHASPTPVAVAAAAPEALTTTTALNTDAWVTVGTDGVAKTVTPVLTIVSGVASLVDASPTTSGVGMDTATTTAQPEATATNGGGSFPVCANVDGDLAPFCAPADRTTLNPGQTYYITWDPAYFATRPNTTVIVTGNLYNETTGDITTQAFASNAVAAGWSFWAWRVDKALLSSSRSVNISIAMTYLSAGNSSTTVRGPIVRVAKPEPYRQQPSELPTGAALYIGLPSVFLFVCIMVVGTCVWNKHHRQINIGSAMGRGRYGKLGGGTSSSSSKGYGVGRSRRQRTGGAVSLDSKDAIALKNREEASRGVGGGSGANSHDDDDDDNYDDYGMTRPTHYTDAPSEAEARHQAAYHKNANKSRAAPPLTLSDDLEAPGRPRRDSDALGSLAGTPTEADFGIEHDSTGNAFRDELRRQDKLI